MGSQLLKFSPKRTDQADHDDAAQADLRDCYLHFFLHDLLCPGSHIWYVACYDGVYDVLNIADKQKLFANKNKCDCKWKTLVDFA